MPYNSSPSPFVNLSASLPSVGRIEITDPTAPIRARQDEIARQDQIRQQQKHDQVIEAMIKDPKNAGYYSKAFGVPISPELGALLQEPEKAQKLLEASKIADSMGLKSYEAKRAFTQKFIESGGNLAEAGAATQGMDTREPLTRYQEAMIGINNDRNSINRDRMDRTDFNAGNKPHAPKTVPLGFGKDAADQIDLMRGVKWVSPKDHSQGLQQGSAAPLDDATMSQLISKAAADYQQSGDPYSAIHNVYDSMGGEKGFIPGADSPFEQESGHWYTPNSKVKYQSIKPQMTPPISSGGPAPAGGGFAAGGAPILTMPDGSRVQPPTPDPTAPASPGGPPQPPPYVPKNGVAVEFNGKQLYIDNADLPEAMAAGAKRMQ